jgi:hypothetical protein
LRDVPVRFLVKPSFYSHQGNLKDLSPKGVSLSSISCVEPGTDLAIQVHTRQDGLPMILSAQVRHCTRQSDGVWLLGCSLSRMLSDYELFALL